MTDRIPDTEIGGTQDAHARPAPIPPARASIQKAVRECLPEKVTVTKYHGIKSAQQQARNAAIDELTANLKRKGLI